MGDPAAEDYYKVLGVARDASEQDISKAYKKAAIRWHPDKNQGDPKAEENFKKVAEAYDCLSNADKRAAYDRFGKAGVNGNGMGPGGAAFNSEQAEAIFKSFFGSADPMEMFLNGGMGGGAGMGGMPGGFSCHFGSMDGGTSGAGPRMMFSSMGGMPGGMGGMGGGMPFGPDLFSQMGGMGMGGMPPHGRGGGRGGGRSVRPKRSVRFNEIPVSTPVALTGLKSTAHNGRTGRVSAFDPDRQRYTVQLDAEDEQLAVRAENLVQMLSVEITDLQTESEHALNGSKGKLLAWDSERERYHVQLPGGRVAALSPGNVILPPDTRCVIMGLESENARQYNGSWGKVVSYDRDTGRYELMVAEGSHLKLRRSCVRA